MKYSDSPDPSRSPFTRAAGPATPGSSSSGSENEEQFRELLNHLEQVFWMTNAADTAVLYVSPAYEKVWGYSRASLYDGSHTFLDSVHPEDHARMAAAMEREREQGGYNEEYRIIGSDGTMRWIWARTYPVRNDKGEVARYAGIAENISDRKWAEKERTRLAAIIEHADDSIISTTLDGTIIAWNRGAERKYGYSAAEVLGRSIFILIPPEHSTEYLEAMKSVRGGKAVSAYRTVRLRKDGTLIKFSVGIAPIEARDGEIVGASKISQDVTRVHDLESQLIEAQKMEVIGQLTGGVAHDFNNILAVILGYSELMVSEIGENPGLQKFAAGINLAAGRGVGLTRQLLVFSRKETVQFTVLDPNKILTDMESMLRQLIDARIALTITTEPGLGCIKADGGYIGQVLMNLVVNARDAMPSGGKLTIATSSVTLDEAYALDHPSVFPGDYILFKVEDTGIGMSEEIKARVFDPLFTTKLRGLGTGLGLSTCQTIVHLSNGFIAVQSTPGIGTSFEVYFPQVAMRSDPARHTTDAGPVPRGTETILVVEDDPEVRRMVSLVLEVQGYHVVTASNGEEGIRRALEDHKHRISLVISDVVMPGMSGQAMVAGMEAIDPRLKFLFTSGYTNGATALSGIIDEKLEFLSKPYTNEALARKVRHLLDAPLV